MSATAALSAAAVADLAAGGPDDVRAFTARAGDRRPASLALVAGLLRLGFLASFISEPVLKGFIIGLALTIIIGQVPKLFGDREGRRRLLRAAVGRRSPPRRHRRAARSSSASSRWRIVLGLRRLRAGRSRLAGRRAARRRRRRAVRPRRPRASRSSARSTAGCRRRPARRAGSHDYLDAAGARSAIMLVGFAEGLGAAKTYAAARPLRDRPQPRAARARRRQPRRRASSAGWSSTAASRRPPSTAPPARAVAALRARRRRADGRHAAVPHRPVRDLPEATLAAVVIAAVDRARRHRRAASGSTALYTERLGPHLRHRRPPRLPRRARRAARRAGLRHAARAVHRHRRLAAAAALPRVAARTSPMLGQRAGHARPVRRRRAPPGERADPGRRRRCASRAGCSSPTPTRCARRSSSARRRRARAAVVLDAETVAVRRRDRGADARRARRRSRPPRACARHRPRHRPGG